MVTITVDHDLILTVIGAVLLVMGGLVIATEAAVEGRVKTPAKWTHLESVLFLLVLITGIVGGIAFLVGVTGAFIDGVS